MVRFVVSALLRIYSALLWLAELLGPRPAPARAEPKTVLLTLTFHADNWALAHLRPLALSSACREVIVVSSTPLPAIDKVRPVQPPRWLNALAGRVPARLLCFAWVAVRERPHYVGGFHLLFNGLAAALVARLVGAHSLYFCVGGPMEVVDGGLHSENRLFERIGRPDSRIEAQLIALLGRFDQIITMGRGAERTFRAWGVTGAIDVAAGGIDTSQFRPAQQRDIDVIIVARLAPIKRIDLFLSALRIVADKVPDLRAVVIGDGVLRPDLELMAAQLELNRHIEFLGHRTDVGSWLQRSKVFVLTSESEGLALSLMEAMLCGAVPVVAAVGELPDLVSTGRNGFTVEQHTPDAFAEPIAAILLDDRTRAVLSQEAVESARRFELRAAVRFWDECLARDRQEANGEAKRVPA